MYQGYRNRVTNNSVCTTGINYSSNLAFSQRSDDIPVNHPGDWDAGLASWHQCTHTDVEYSLNHLFVLCIECNSPLLNCQVGPTAINTPWSQFPVSFLWGTVVVHRMDTCFFIVPHVHLHSMLDSNVNAGKLTLMQSILLILSLLKVTWVAHLFR